MSKTSFEELPGSDQAEPIGSDYDPNIFRAEDRRAKITGKFLGETAVQPSAELRASQEKPSFNIQLFPDPIGLRSFMRALKLEKDNKRTNSPQPEAMIGFFRKVMPDWHITHPRIDDKQLINFQRLVPENTKPLDYSKFSDEHKQVELINTGSNKFVSLTVEEVFVKDFVTMIYLENTYLTSQELFRQKYGNK